MNTKKNTKFQNVIDTGGKVASIGFFSMAALSTIVLVAWKAYAVPILDKKIESKVKPIETRVEKVVDAIEYQNFLLIGSMDSASLTKANKLYEDHKKAILILTKEK